MRKIIILFLCILIGCRPDREKTARIDELDSLEFIRNLADSTYNVNDFRSALFYFNLLIHADSSNAENYFKRAYCNAEMKHLVESNQDYLKSIRLNYRVIDCYNNLGINEIDRLDSKDDSLALYYFIKVLELDPSLKSDASKSAKKAISQIRMYPRLKS